MCTFQELLETTSESAGLCGTLIQEAVVMRFFLGTMLLIFIGRICRICRICRIVPPLNIFGLGGVRVPILFGNDLPRNDLTYSKGFMKFGCQEPSKKCLTLFWGGIASEQTHYSVTKFWIYILFTDCHGFSTYFQVLDWRSELLTEAIYWVRNQHHCQLQHWAANVRRPFIFHVLSELNIT